MIGPDAVLGLIPARGGSKGLPGKNVRELAGKPLIAWTVDAAIESGVLDAVVVTTDDAAIADAATAAGAEVPFVRPPELASDDALMIHVVLDAIERLEQAGRSFRYVMLLQPTSPLRIAEDIRGAVARLRETDGRAVVSVCPAEHSPLLANTLPDDGAMASFLRREVSTANRQELPTYYRLNGALYLAEVDFLREQRTFIADGTYAYVMPVERSVDVDTAFDLLVAEAVLRSR